MRAARATQQDSPSLSLPWLLDQTASGCGPRGRISGETVCLAGSHATARLTPAVPVYIRRKTRPRQGPRSPTQMFSANGPPLPTHYPVHIIGLIRQCISLTPCSPQTWRCDSLGLAGQGDLVCNGHASPRNWPQASPMARLYKQLPSPSLSPSPAVHLTLSRPPVTPGFLLCITVSSFVLS